MRMQKTVNVTDKGVGQENSGIFEEPPTQKSYDVIQLLGDTEIVAADGDNGEYQSIQEARDVAIDYLEGVIELCEIRMEEIRNTGVAA
jgi:hypothetical protein